MARQAAAKRRIVEGRGVKALEDAAKKTKKSTTGPVVMPGKDMPRTRRNETAPKPVKVEKAKRGQLKIAGITLDVGGVCLDAGVDGEVYMIPKLSPKTCAALLTRRPRGQRGLRPSHMRLISGDMRIGAFFWTGAVIRINGDGMLIDGQHRLSAAVDSKTTMQNVVLVIVRKKASIGSIDEGARRTIRDKRQIMGKPLYDPSVFASIKYEGSGGVDWNGGAGRQMSNEELDRLTDAITYMPIIHKIFGTAKRQYGHIDNSLCAVAIRVMRKHQRAGAAFFLAIADNDHEIDGKISKQVKAACGHMMAMSTAYKEGTLDGDTKRRRIQGTHKLIQAWNAHRASEQLPSPWRYVKGSKMPAIL